MTRKAQSEVLGLLVIVVILLVLGVIYLGFVNLAQGSSLTNQRTSLEAERALQTLMKVSFPAYGDQTFEELIVACHKDPKDCILLEEALQEAYLVILRPGTLYSFTATYQEEAFYSTGLCSLGLVSHYVFVTDGLAYETQLQLCTQ